MRIYTKTGDCGTTGLQGGDRRTKSDQRIVAYGCVDEANAAIGVALSHMQHDHAGRLRDILSNVQNDLFDLGADLSDPSLQESAERMSEEAISRLEAHIDALDSELAPLANFILPGGSTASAALHMSRAVVRRAEIEIVKLSQQEQIGKNCIKYVNRLSDLLFILSRIANKQAGINDILWRPG